MSAARFEILTPSVNGYMATLIFYARDEATLLRALTERLPGMKRDQALIGVDSGALEMLLRLSTCNLCGGLGRVADGSCPNGCAR